MRKTLALVALALVLAGCGHAGAPKQQPAGDPRVQDYGTHAPIVYRICYYYPDNFDTTCIATDRAHADSMNPGQMRTITYTVSATYVDVYFQMSR